MFLDQTSHQITVWLGVYSTENGLGLGGQNKDYFVKFEGETEILTDLKKSENLALMPSNIKFIDDEEGTLDKLSNNKILYDLTKEKNA